MNTRPETTSTGHGFFGQLGQTLATGFDTYVQIALAEQAIESTRPTYGQVVVDNAIPESQAAHLATQQQQQMMLMVGGIAAAAVLAVVLLK